MTTREPGARLVLTHGFVCMPRSTAFLASSPAATISIGLEVFVQLVMAAMATEPAPSWVPFACSTGKAFEKLAGGLPGGKRAWGGRGPARGGCTSERSK